MLQEDNIQISKALTKPDRKDPFHTKMEPKWGKIRTVLAGADALREAEETYTPRFEQEDDKTYKRRLAKTDLTNVLEDTIENAVAKPFSEPLKIDEDNSAKEYIEWSEDIDRQGSDLSTFAEDVFYQSIADGLGYILADSPDIGDQPLTVKRQKDENIRPFLLFIDAPSMLAFRRSNVSGALVPTYIRYIVESTDFDEDSKAIEVKTVHEIQAYTPDKIGYYRTYESRKGVGKEYNTWKVIKEGEYVFDQVTVVRVNFGKKHERNADVITPPFLGLADTNIAHWNSQSDQNNVLEHARFAMYHFENMEEPKDGEGNAVPMSFGPGKFFFSPPTDSSLHSPKISAVELPTEGLKEGWEDLDRKEASMKTMGLDAQTSKNAGALTASERIIEASTSNSKLTNWALKFAEALEKAFSYLGLWAGIRGDAAKKVQIIINTEFGVSEKELSEIKILRDMQAMGQLSLRTLLEELRRKQIFDSEFNVDEEMSRILKEQPDDDYEDYEPLSRGTPPEDDKIPKDPVKKPAFPKAA